MFYLVEIEDYIRVDPRFFGLPTLESVERQLKETYKEYYDKYLGKVITVINVIEVGEGIIIPGDGATYYSSKFILLTWKPEIHELVYGVVSEITNFGAFINMGIIRGMIHIGQTMDDYVSFSKANSLLGKSTKRNLKQSDPCLARIVAISHKGEEPKIGLTMRQPGLGKLEWLEEEKKKLKQQQKKAIKEDSKKTKKK